MTPTVRPMLSRIAADVVVLDGITGLSEEDGRLRVARAHSDEVLVAGLFAATGFEQSAPFAEQLGLEMSEVGGVSIDIMGRTSLPGVYAAGDLAHHRDLPMPMASVAAATAAGQVAGAAFIADSLLATT